MEIVMFVVLLAVPAFVVVTFVLMMQTRSKVKKVASIANKCYKRQIADDMHRMNGGGMEPEKVQAYIDDMFCDDMFGEDD